MVLCQSQFKRIALISLALLATCSVVQGDPLVTRNDFVCYDSSYVYPWAVTRPDVAIDGNGNLKHLTQVGDQSLPWPNIKFSWKLLYNSFSPDGDLDQPSIALAPFPSFSGADSLWIAIDRTRVDANESGVTAVVFEAYAQPTDSTPGYDVALFAQQFDQSGQPVDDPVELMSIDLNADLWGEFDGPSVHVSNAGLIGVATYYRDVETNIAAYLYDPVSGGVSPTIHPTDLPHPIEQEPGYGGHYALRAPACIGVADNGSFVVAWLVYDDALEHVSYVVYNADYTPATEVLMADCEFGFFDTANCVSYRSMNVSMDIESDGDFYLAWYGHSWGGRADGVYMRGFYADGAPKYAAINVAESDQLNMHPADGIHPRLTCNDSGNVLVVWSDARFVLEYASPVDIERALFAQKIDPQGNLVGHNYRIDDPGGRIDQYGWYADADLNNAGQTVVTWKNHDLDHTIRAQLMPYHSIGSFVPGDINYDLESSISDLVALIDYMFMSVPNSFWPPSLLDFDGNNSNGDISDLVYIVDWMFNDGPQPHTPYEGIRPPLE